MAKGKFFNGKVKKDRSAYLKYGLIGAGIILIIILFALIAAGKGKRTVVLELKSVVTVEINEKPKVKDFFDKLKNFDEDKITVDDFDYSTIGTYQVEISAEGQGAEVITVNVVDTTAPELKVKDIAIKSGTSYKIEDFVESCTDNSKGECIVEYFSADLDENGNPIDYSKFSEDNEYIIKIIAKDQSGNSTTAQEVHLTIGNQTVPENPTTDDPINCTYGDLTVDARLYNYPLAVIVADQNKGCAINRDLWDNDNILTTVNNFYNTDYQKLKKELEPLISKEYPTGANVVAYPQYSAVLNEQGTGLVGYGIFVNVYITNANSDEKVDQQKNLKLSYYIKTDSSRDYITNEYNLK